MSITITVTDPTPAEAERIADYFFELAGFGRRIVPTHETGAARDGDSVDAAYVARLVATDDGTAPVDTAAIFGAQPAAGEIGSSAMNTALVMDAEKLRGTGADPATNVQIDSSGLPWDGRIHASSRAVIANGTWRMKRGVDDATVASVTAELRAAMAAPAATVTQIADVAPPPPAAAVPPWPFPPVADVPPAAAVPPPPLAAAAAPPPPPGTTGPLTFPEFMKRATPAMTAGTLTEAMIVAALAEVQLPSLPMLVSRPDLVPTVAAKLGLIQ